MAIKKSVRLTHPTIELLRPFSDVTGDGMNWSGSINSMAEYMQLIIEDNTPELPSHYWMALRCAYNGYMPHPNPKTEAEMLHWHIDQSYQHDEQVAEFIGGMDEFVTFIELLKHMSLTQRLCVIYKAKQFWRTGPITESPHCD